MNYCILHALMLVNYIMEIKDKFRLVTNLRFQQVGCFYVCEWSNCKENGLPNNVWYLK